MRIADQDFVSEAVAVDDQQIADFTPSSEGNVKVARPELTVIVPVYNEIKTVEEVLRRVVHESTPKDIVIVDDGSTDGTTELLETWHTEWRSKPPLQRIHRVMTLRHPVNRGKGAAIRTALEHARSEFVVVQDADLEVSPEEYSWLLKPLAAGEADIVIGFRTQAQTSPKRFAHGAGIHLLNLAVRVLYGVWLKDEACCFKVLRTHDLKRMNLECRGFEFCPEVVAKAARLGLRFGEVPVAYAPRNSIDGKKLRLRDGLQAILTLWKYRHWREG